MTLLTFFNLLHFTLVLWFGLSLSTAIAGEWDIRRQLRLSYTVFPLLLLLQGILWLLFDTAFVEMLYPLITHLPIVLLLVGYYHKSIGVAIVSVCTAYLCCQIPHWGQIAALALTQSALFSEVCYLISIAAAYLLLYRFFVKAVHHVIMHSKQTLFLFGSLPMAYYFFDYATTVYSDALHTNISAIQEFLPTVLVVFYVIFLTAYHFQVQAFMQAELQNSMLEMKQKQTQTELSMLRQSQQQTAIYQHDMRHHLMMIDSLLQTGKSAEASAYIRQAEQTIVAIAPKRFCENETVNLLCSHYAGKAEQEGIAFISKVQLPNTLSIADTELCAILSNGLENALHAVRRLAPPARSIQLYCQLKHESLLIEIRNPYAGDLVMQNGLPVTTEEGHGYGCQSIYSIATQHHGHCVFQTEDNIFTLRVALPMQSTATS